MNTSATEFFLKHPVFTTKEFSFFLKVRMDSAARTLTNFEKKKIIKKVTRGIWANDQHPHFSRYGLVPYLLGTEQGYVSFLSALHRHGVISQIPQKIFVATTGHSRRLRCSFGEFEFIQIHPRYMQIGIDWFSTTTHYGLATAEKALLDSIYLSTRKGHRFSHFPELDVTEFKKKIFFKLMKEQDFPVSIQIKIKSRFYELVGS